MIAWKNMNTLASYQELQNAERVNLAAAMSGENGAERVKNYSVPMAADMDFNFARCPVWSMRKERRSVRSRQWALVRAQL